MENKSTLAGINSLWLELIITCKNKSASAWINLVTKFCVSVVNWKIRTGNRTNKLQSWAGTKYKYMTDRLYRGNHLSNIFQLDRKLYYFQ